MSDVPTFRDFAGAVMQNDMPAAARVLENLLGIDSAHAQSAAAHFQAQMQSDPQFMMKAMGMRAVVEQKDEAGLVALLGECFALDAALREAAAKTVLARYR
jgi:hypothetical protein